MNISEVAKRTGLPASTLRFYEEKGLITSLGRKGLQRRFGPGILDHLALINLAQAAGFSLAEIAKMFGKDGSVSIDRKALLAKADDIERSMRRLKAMRNGLRHAAVCSAPSHLECPKFKRLIRLAGRGAFAIERGSKTLSALSPSKRAKSSK
jgi:DNA-binding transcriptional MerR regulator